MPFKLTRWVRRLLVVTGGVYLLQLTVFTSPWFAETFGFAPDLLTEHPWSILTYAFLHASFFHLFFNMLALFMFGPPVEERLGSTRFIRLYVVAALGGSLLSLAFAPLTAGGITIGASAAVFGVMLAFVLYWPDAPILIFPLPIPIRAKWLVLGMVAISLFAGLSGKLPGVAHLAHLGGFAAAFLYLRGAALLHLRRARAPRRAAHAVLVHPTGAAAARHDAPARPGARQGADAAVLAEMDRVLDKIRVGGLPSLTPEERRFLDEVSRRFRQEN